MQEIKDFFTNIFDTSRWPPRWHCGEWSSFHGWLYIISDLLIWAAYFTIPVIIIRYISRKRHAKFIKLYFLFAGFILACGATHFMDAVMFWYPAYRLSALLRLITAVVSWLTIFSLLKVLPTAFSLKTSEELETEIEQRKVAETALKAKNQQLSTAEAISGMGHWRWNIVTNEIAWSDNLKKIFGFTSQPTYDDYIASIHAQDRETVVQYLDEAVNHGNFKDFYHRIHTTTGEEKILYVRADFINNNGQPVTEILGTAQDVTLTMKTQQALEQKTKELEQLNFELEKFNHIASHDLQEPLRKIALYGQLLLEQQQETLTGKAAQYLQRIVTASKRMRDMVSAIVTFSLVRRQEVVFAPTDLNEVLRHVQDDLELKIASTGAVINVSPLPVIDANALQLEQLFQNLVSNALKFMPQGKAPVINIYAEEAAHTPGTHPPGYPAGTHRYTRIIVQDNGVGFEEKYQAVIFDLFSRANTTYEGTGLGLAICKKIVQNHHGAISARSTPGQGSVFIVELPYGQ